MAYQLTEALQLLESGVWLEELTFITADTNKGTGGKVISLGKCRIARQQTASLNQILQAQTPQHTDAIIQHLPNVLTGASKSPNHNIHFTRNLQLANNQVRKVHPILITSINNTPVI